MFEGDWKPRLMLRTRISPCKAQCRPRPSTALELTINMTTMALCKNRLILCIQWLHFLKSVNLSSIASTHLAGSRVPS